MAILPVLSVAGTRSCFCLDVGLHRLWASSQAPVSVASVSTSYLKRPVYHCTKESHHFFRDTDATAIWAIANALVWIPPHRRSSAAVWSFVVFCVNSQAGG